MKKLVLLVVIFTVAVGSSLGQDFKKFKVGIGIGYGQPSDGSGGILIYLEPAYRVMDQLSIGLRIESAAFLDKPISGTSITTGAYGVGSYTLNGQYYFSNNNFRPFVGAGLGMFTVAAASADLGSGSVTINAATTLFGFYPRVGFDFGHFNFSIDYNILPAQTAQVDLGALGIQTQTSNYTYIGIRLGASIGGGRK